MKHPFLLSILSVCILASCNDFYHNTEPPLKEGTEITMRNTLEDAIDGPTEETIYSVLFGQAENAFDEMAILSDEAVEFATALAQGPEATGGPNVSGLYRIDFTENRISYTFLPQVGDPFWEPNFRILAEGVVDRYYFTFSEHHNISGYTASDRAVGLRIDSEEVIVVEIGEGFGFQPGASFTLTLE
ncbi:MAG: hypothetical protein AAGA86_08760 [Bacteroidota bacterium]